MRSRSVHLVHGEDVTGRVSSNDVTYAPAVLLRKGPVREGHPRSIVAMPATYRRIRSAAVASEAHIAREATD
jgi:hypothetical protein